MGGWVGGWLENEFLKKTPSPKFGLESQLGTSDLEFVNEQRRVLHLNPKVAINIGLSTVGLLSSVNLNDDACKGICVFI